MQTALLTKFINKNKRADVPEFRPGDMRHSLADIGKVERLLGYRPTYSIEQGIEEALPWYIDRFR